MRKIFYSLFALGMLLFMFVAVHAHVLTVNKSLMALGFVVGVLLSGVSLSFAVRR